MKIKQNLLFTLIIMIFAYCPDAVFAACTVSASPLSFGSYNVFSASPLDATGAVTINCDESPPPTVTISVGQSTNSGGFNPRAMKLTTGSELLLYNLYTDSNRTYIWGNGSGNSTVSSKANKNNPAIHTVYGRIPPLQNVSAGSYNERLTVTVIW